MAVKQRKVGKSDVKVKSRKKICKTCYLVTDNKGVQWIEFEDA